MSVSAAGSAQSVQIALNAIRQNIQAEQVASAAVVEAANQASKNAAQTAQQVNAVAAGRGAQLDVKA